MKRLDIYEFAEQHKDCPVRIKEYVVKGKKYIVHSHFVGEKDAHGVIIDNAITHAINDTFGDYLYGSEPVAFDDDNNSDCETKTKIIA